MTIDKNSTEIILADDDHEEVLIFENALENISVQYVLRHAENGDILVMLLKELIPDFLFLDIHMPRKNGISCIEEIRADSRFDMMPVIMYTSLTSPEHIAETYRKGANFCIEKVGDITDLAEKLRYIFSLNWKQKMTYPKITEYLL